MAGVRRWRRGDDDESEVEGGVGLIRQGLEMRVRRRLRRRCRALGSCSGLSWYVGSMEGGRGMRLLETRSDGSGGGESEEGEHGGGSGRGQWERAGGGSASEMREVQAGRGEEQGGEGWVRGCFGGRPETR
eukprot:61433-Rhodomonas_salina.1